MSLKINNDNEITVIEGYHFGRRPTKKDPKHKHNVIYTGKPYNFRVTKKTGFPNRAKVGRMCRVSTAKGFGQIVITKIMHVKGAVALKFAKGLKPVRRFSYFGMYPLYLYKILDSKTGLDIHPEKLTKEQVKERAKKSAAERHVITRANQTLKKHTKGSKHHRHYHHHKHHYKHHVKSNAHHAHENHDNRRKHLHQDKTEKNPKKS